jgi:membrane-associated phospholipid phosphatase
MHDQRHYLSDCVVGALFGWGLVGFLWRRLPFFEGLIARFLPWKPAFYQPKTTEAVSQSRRAA